MIAEELKQRLQTETPRIRELARLSGDEAFFTHKTTSIASPLGELPFRMETVEKLELRIDKSWPKAQAEVAAIHGLGYLKDGKRNRWVDVTDPSLTEEDRQYIEPVGKGKRSENFLNGPLQQIRDLNVGKGLKTSMRKVDLALFAHACQLPMDTFLLAFEDDNMNRLLFNQWISFSKEGKNLFAQDTSFLDQFSNAARGSIRFEHLQLTDSLPQDDLQEAAHQIVNPNHQDKRPEGPLPGFRMRAARPSRGIKRAAQLRAGIDLRVTITPPEDYTTGCELLILEKDDWGELTLISTALNLDGTTRFAGEEFIIPRLNDGSEAKGDEWARLILDCAGYSRIYVLMLKQDPNTDTVLQTLPSFHRTTEEAYVRNPHNFDTRFGEEDFAELRKILLQRDQSSWLCLHHNLLILPANL
jgi:hypothetical protein